MKVLIAVVMLLFLATPSTFARKLGPCEDQCLQDAENLAILLSLQGHSDADATQRAALYYKECVGGCGLLASKISARRQATDIVVFTRDDFSLANWHYPPLDVTGSAKILRDICTNRIVSPYECLKGLSEGKALPPPAPPVPWLDWRDGKWYSYGLQVAAPK